MGKAPAKNTVAHRERIAAMGKSKNEKKDDGGLPWYFDEPAPTTEVVEEIVYHFHTYALRGKVGSENKEEFDRLGRTFNDCIGFVRGYFKDNARQINTPEARGIAKEALELVDEFDSWFYPRGQVTKQDSESYGNIFRRWKKVVREFNMCMPSGNQAKKSSEKERNPTPAKCRSIWTLVKRIPRWIYVLVIFLAALLTILYYLGWLKPD